MALVVGCGAPKLKSTKAESFFNTDVSKANHFTGFLVIDPKTNDTLVNHNANKYFTPASTTKIFTLYTALKLIPEKLPAIKYLNQNDTLYIEGVGNPTLLHQDFQSGPFLEFLDTHQNIALHLNNYSGHRYGPGWAWEDYDTYFSPEIGSLPLFGNVVTITQMDSLIISPDYFMKRVFKDKKPKLRDELDNKFHIPYTTDTLRIPFITGKLTTKALLETTLNSPITLINKMPEGVKKTFSMTASDSLYKKMLLESDNFLAEQILLMASSQISDTISFQSVKEHILENYLSDLKHEPRWVDGSGLSRYNLFTPNSMVSVLHSLYREYPKDKLFHLFPRWDENGSFENDKSVYSFIIAKSGALGNNYNLCGYLITKSGKILIFGHMNNHFRVPTKEIRGSIKKTLQQLHNLY